MKHYLAIIFFVSNIVFSQNNFKISGKVSDKSTGEGLIGASVYLDGVMTRLTLIGSLYLSLVALLPQFLIIAWHVPFYFGGTSLLIVVVVVMDFIGQIQARLMSHKYEALMKKGAGKSGSSALSLLH